MRPADLARRAAGRIPGETPLLDAELLLAHAMGIGRDALLFRREPVPGEAMERFAALVARRIAHEPVAYILGFREFWSLPIAVSPQVLIPRPDSETLIEAALRHFGTQGPATILDLGTGSGALLLAALAEWPGAMGVGLDRSPAAIAVARANARALGFGPRASFLVSDWAAALDARFDLVLANPPYVETGAELQPEVRREPGLALFAGADGLECIRALAPELPRLVAPGGVAVVEIGASQADAAVALLLRPGFEPAVFEDLAGRPRAIALRRAWQAGAKPVSGDPETAAASGNRAGENPSQTRAGGDSRQAGDMRGRRPPAPSGRAGPRVERVRGT